MQLNLEKSSENTLIRRVREENGKFEIQIAENVYSSSVILSPAGVSLWQATRFSELREDDFLALANLDTEVILLGTGRTIQFPDPGVTRALVDKQKGLEVMDTAAACRTYNILLGDGRLVSAALIIES